MSELQCTLSWKTKTKRIFLFGKFVVLRSDLVLASLPQHSIRPKFYPLHLTDVGGLNGRNYLQPLRTLCFDWRAPPGKGLQIHDSPDDSQLDFWEEAPELQIKPGRRKVVKREQLWGGIGAKIFLDDNVDDSGLPLTTRNPVEPPAAGDKVVRKRTGGTTESGILDGSGTGGENQNSWARAGMAPLPTLRRRTDRNKKRRPCLRVQLQNNCSACCSSGCTWGEGQPGWGSACANKESSFLDGPHNWVRIVAPANCTLCNPEAFPGNGQMEAPILIISFISVGFISLFFLICWLVRIKRRKPPRQDLLQNLEEAL